MTVGRVTIVTAVLLTRHMHRLPEPTVSTNPMSSAKRIVLLKGEIFALTGELAKLTNLAVTAPLDLRVPCANTIKQ
jgi:hypothetical protein